MWKHLVMDPGCRDVRLAVLPRVHGASVEDPLHRHSLKSGPVGGRIPVRGDLVSEPLQRPAWMLAAQG